LREDFNNWNPLTVTQINDIFSGIPITWGIAGGWALDLHIDKKTREHSDIDVVIFREHLNILFQHFKSIWLLFKAEKGRLELWEEDESLNFIHNLWVSKNFHNPWAFQILVVDSVHNEWVYKREKSIRRSKEEIFYQTNEGVPYLRPEIQLLYKAGSSEIREKDNTDFKNTLPYLLLKEKEWLRTSLTRQFPEGHAWLESL